MLTRAEGIAILLTIAEAAPTATAAIARRMADAFRGVPGATMPTDAEIEALYDAEEEE